MSNPHSHCVILNGESRSFPESHPLLDATVADGDILVLAGADAGESFAGLADTARYSVVLIELGSECLGVHTGESRGEEGSNVLGFARFRLGDAKPSDLVEIVRQPQTAQTAVEAARALFEAHGLKTAVCGDFPGRIVDRLVRPYYNAALNRLDAKLATAADMDLTLKLGLGYPEGPVELLERTGLAAHHDTTKVLHDALGDPAYAPARRAQVAKARQLKGR
ncbi:3-hydroxybutyryl-CoA dehydrogenase [Pseudochelatococcus lubricantis]|uniref:3-hydroxybutyryl-CoA dehydrogenase n=1 Tax=Pseudochelatococcus lubricantis TaxID=1538102 RepID=A0ABX0UUB5_9HYPH|nr:3-hydroxyacyl-CoA dehydrogenase family protein [Pseudochelatococcus lubricantis]NIJ56367.1 3-hydroxybutyryl-CoA dehydrogenase [Pseudochelatococcus lubricantis]